MRPTVEAGTAPRTVEPARVAGVDLRRLDADGLVERPRLIRQLETWDAPVAVLDASAGYGKSVLLAQWSTHDSRPFASITLTDSHNDPAILLASVVEALDRIESVPDDVAPAMLPPEPDLSLILPRLESAIHAREVPMVLVLDELEHIESGESLRLIDAIAQNMPPGSQLALATRSGTLPHIGRLRANRRLIELGRTDLIMTRRECRELLAGIGLELSPEQLDTLIAKTEGWPAALYLAGRSLLKEPDLGAAIDRLAGDERTFIDYISDELLGQQPQRRVEFLTRASILDRLTGDLCDAVLDRTGSTKVLQELSHGNMLLIPLDHRDEWFRMHSLLTDMLRSELRRTAPQEISALHRRASQWWSESGDSARAIHHAIEAGDLDRAGELIWEAVPEYLARGRYATMRRWLDRIGQQRLVTDPFLTVTVAHGHLSRGEGGLAEHWSGVTHELLKGMRRSGKRDSVVAGMALVDGALARGGVADMSENAALAAASLSGESPWLSMCRLIEGVGNQLGGRHEPAHENLTEAARRAAIWGVPIVQVLSLAQLALLAADEEDWQLARMVASQARAQVERSDLGEYPTMALVFATSAFVRAREERLDGVVADLRAATRLLGRLDQFGTWYEAEARSALAAAAAGLNDVPLAREQLEEAVRSSNLTPGAPALASRLEGVRAVVDRISTESVADLTPAELRVLRLLPSHRSLPEIAAELCLSPNTVKTQAQAAYRKLGVSSRGDAVERARRAGLLSSNADR